MEPYVFISYSSQNYAQAQGIRNHLERSGLRCWMAPDNIEGGKSYASQIPQAINNCGAFVLVLDRAAMASQWVSREVDRAINQKKRIFPFMTEYVSLTDEFAFYFNNAQYYTAFQNYGRALDQMTRELAAHLQVFGTPSPINPTLSSPTPTPNNSKKKRGLLIGLLAVGAAFLAAAVLLIALHPFGDHLPKLEPSLSGDPASSKSGIKASDTAPSPSGDPAASGTEAAFSQGAVAPTKTLVASGINTVIQYQETSYTAYIQDPVSYFGSAANYEPTSISHDHVVRKFSCDAEDLSIVKAYVSALADGTHNLIIVSSYEKTYSDTFFSWGLDYTGAAEVLSKVHVTFTDDSANVLISGTLEKKKLVFTVWIPHEMEPVDLGLRLKGGNTAGGDRIAGNSVGTGLYRYSDGRYETEDGVFLLNGKGTASILRDGKSYEGNAELKRSIWHDAMIITDYYRNEFYYIGLPPYEIEDRSVYTLKDLLVTQEPIVRDGGIYYDNSFKIYFSSTHFAPVISMFRNQYDTCAVDGPKNIFREATVRILYIEPDKEAVIYFYAAFDTEPKEIEGVFCVSLAPEDIAVEQNDSGNSHAADDEGLITDSSKVRTCTFCKGGWVSCKTCNGTGKTEQYESGGGYHGLDDGKTVVKACRSCHGSGGHDCSVCGGDGLLGN